MGDEGGLPTQNAKGTKRKVQRVVDKYAASKQQSTSSVASQNAPDIERRNSELSKSVTSSGDSFGEGLKPEYVKANPTETDDVLGKTATKRQRTASRRKGINDALDSIDSVMSGKESKDAPEITKDSVDEQVAQIISSTPREKLVEILEDTAQKMHESFDRRVRVRATEKDIEDIAKSGAMRPNSLDAPRAPINQKEVGEQYAGFTTSSGSKYVYGPDGRVSREKNPTTSTTIDDRIVTSSLDNTAFVSEEDLKNIQTAFDRGIPFREDGSVRALRYDDSSMDMDRFMQLRRDGVAFDDAYKQSGGVISEYKPELSLEPSIGKHPFEWNEDGKKWHAGSSVSSVEARPESGAVSESRRALRRSKGPRKTRKVEDKLKSGEKLPDKPKRPRAPDNGPFTGKFAEIFNGSKTYSEMLDRYNNLEVVFFDYETTGFDPADGNMPTQIGAVRMKNGQILGRFNVFVNPGRPLGKWARENLKDADGNPLTDEYLSKMPSIKDAHEQLIAFFGPDALLGGQYTPFDLEVLNRMLKQEGIDYTPSGVIDSKAISDELLPRWTPENPIGPSDVNPETGETFGTNSLGPLSKYLGVDLKSWHTADADSEASALVTQKLLELAARGEAVSDEMLDVDGMPERQRQKQIKYEADMEKYKVLKKEYDELVKSAKEAASREKAERISEPISATPTTDPSIPGINRGKLRETDRLSSGGVQKNLSRGSRKSETRRIESTSYKTNIFGDEIYDNADVYEIGDEKVIFGAPADSQWGEDVKTVAINPYEISGMDMMSDEGRELAVKWTAAHAAAMMDREGKPTTYVDSLLYAGIRGDEDAMEEFERLAEIGEAAVEAERPKRYARDLNDSEKEAIAREGLQDVSVDDLFLVHETKYDFQKDKDGNIVIRPLGDYELTTTDGDKVRYERDTVHFAVNHLAAGHISRQREKGTKIVIIPLRDMLESNPDSLDTLFTVDTYLTPKPGEGLLFPSDKIRTIDVDDGNADELVTSALRDMGAKHIFEPGEYGSSRGADAAVFKVAKELGANFGTHAGLSHSSIEKVNRKDPNTPMGVQYEIPANTLADLSKNARMRIAKTDRWAGAKSRVRDDDRLYSGRVGQSAKRGVRGGVTSRVAGRLLDAALKRSGVDEDTRDRVEFGMGVATAFAAGGPAGAIAMVAKEAATRGGRDLAEYTLGEMVKRGKISQSQAAIAMRQVDKYAPEGLPEPVKEKLKDGFDIASRFYDERIDTPENRERISEAASEVRSRMAQRASSIRERIGSRRRQQQSTEYELDPFGDMVPVSRTQNASSEEWDPFGDSLSSGGKVSGRSASNLRKEYEKRIGLASGNRATRPVYGYLVNKSQVDEKAKGAQKRTGVKPDGRTPFEVGDQDMLGDGLTALGDIEIVLKPEVSNRTAYGRGDSLSSGIRPVMMNSKDKEDIADAILNPAGPNSGRERLESTIHMLNGYVDGNFSKVNSGIDQNGSFAKIGKADVSERPTVPFEAQILGGFRADEIESINYPYSKIVKDSASADVSDILQEKSVKEKLSALGFTDQEIDYFYSIGAGDGLSTESIRQLREYRTARKVTSRLESMGIGRVNVSHPDGISIMNPTTYDPSANPNADVEDVLKKRIDGEVNEYLEKMLKQMRSSKEKTK
jgi:DNA polymerase III epsilon subunit-like protein